MEFKDIVKIEGLPSARVEQTTPKAICLRFEGNYPTEWLPKSQLEIISEKTIVQSGKNDQVEYICKLPNFIKDKIWVEEEVLSECCGATIHTDTDICSDCLEHTGQ